MRRITPLAPVALSLLALALGATSCKKNKVELEDIQIFDNEIKAFALSTDDAALKEAVSTIPFVIRNTPTGVIYNLQALPYSSTDYNVHLRLMKASDQSSVEVILNGGKPEKWMGETQTFKSSDLLKGIQLRITTGAGNGSSSSYTYKVIFKRYTQDPHAFDWSEASVTTELPAFSTTFSQVELRGKEAGGALYYVTADGKNAVSTFSDPKGTWTPASLSGLTAGERLTSLLTYGGKLYATTSADHLYEASTFGTTFTAKTFPATATPHALLGGLSVEGKPALALVGKTTSGAMNFVRYDLSSGQIATIGEQPQASFPTAGGAQSYELSGSSYAGTALYLAGGRTADGKINANVWATTNGTAWLRVNEKPLDAVAAVSQTQAYVPAQKRIYRFSSTATGLELSISDDRGVTWQAAREVAFTGLTRADFAGYPLVAFPSSDGETIYLLRGVKRAGESAKLFVGKFGGLKTATE
jgi:lipoprotein